MVLGGLFWAVLSGNGLAVVQVGRGALGMGGGAEDGALVVLQHLQLSAAAHNVKERGQIG